MPTITIRDTAAGSDGGAWPAYLAEPVPVGDRSGPWPGVVVMHDAFGLSDDIREQADWLAASGYLALFPDLSNGRSMVRCIKSIGMQLMAQQGELRPIAEDLDEVLSGSCPMVASYGARDISLKGAAAKVRLSLRAAGVPSDVKEYSNARHGFINRTAALSPLNPILRVSGFGHDHESAADAKKRILEFFDVHLRASASISAADAKASQ